MGLFQSTRPVWGATEDTNHKLKEEIFQSTRPVWGATRLSPSWVEPFPNFNPRAPCGARQRSAKRLLRRSWKISIHAPRVGRDDCDCVSGYCRRDFNPRAPCGARHPDGFDSEKSIHNFNPRAPCGARLGSLRAPAEHRRISIHAPRVGRDLSRCTQNRTPSQISIHAPRVGRDQAISRSNRRKRHFNPRAPCGARPVPALLSPPPIAISIHAPRVGRDTGAIGAGEGLSTFQSTRPVWGATLFEDRDGMTYEISIHAPRVGRDRIAPILSVTS